MKVTQSTKLVIIANELIDSIKMSVNIINFKLDTRGVTNRGTYHSNEFITTLEGVLANGAPYVQELRVKDMDGQIHYDLHKKVSGKVVQRLQGVTKDLNHLTNMLKYEGDTRLRSRTPQAKVQLLTEATKFLGESRLKSVVIQSAYCNYQLIVQESNILALEVMIYSDDTVLLDGSPNKRGRPQRVHINQIAQEIANILKQYHQ